MYYLRSVNHKMQMGMGKPDDTAVSSLQSVVVCKVTAFPIIIIHNV
jgi:hypothetical protein